jgi:hypothetical protein
MGTYAEQANAEQLAGVERSLAKAKLVRRSRDKLATQYQEWQRPSQHE